MEPAVLEQRLLEHAHPSKWCPECAGYPCYVIPTRAVLSMRDRLRKVVEKLFNIALLEYDPHSVWVCRCVRCEGVGTWSSYVKCSVPHVAGATKGTYVVPDVNANHAYRTELHWHLTRWYDARLARMMEDSHVNWYPVEAPPTLASWEAGSPYAPAQLGLLGPVPRRS